MQHFTAISRLKSMDLRWLIVLLFFLFINDDAKAQTPEWQWLKRAGGVSTWLPSQQGSPDDEITRIEVDKNGNVYAIGRIFTSIAATIDTAVIKQMRGSQDGIIAKFNCNGILQWYKIIGGPNKDRINDLCLDNEGNVYLTGGMSAGSNTNDSAYIGNVSYKFISSQSFLTKLDSNGQVIWTHIAYSTNSTLSILTASVGYGIGVDADGFIYLYGTSESKGAEFYPGIELNETYFIAKYDQNGHVLWAEKLMPFPNAVLFQTMEVDVIGNCYLVGTIRDTMTIGGTQFNPMNINGESILLQYDSSGSFAWGHISQSPLITNGYGIAIVEKGTSFPDIFMTGNTVAGTKFGNLTIPSTNAAGIGYVIKYENHIPIWERHINSTASTGITNVAVDEFQNVYVSEEIKGNLSIAGMKPNGDMGDSFVAKFSSNGDTIYTLTLLNSKTSRPLSISAGYNGNFYVGGSFEQWIYLPGDSAINIGGNSDMFIAKFGIEECKDTSTTDTTISIAENYNEINSKSLIIYPNPSTGLFIVRLKESTNGQLLIFNPIGELIKEQIILNSNSINIKLPSNIVSGLFLIQIRTESDVYNGQIIINH